MLTRISLCSAGREGGEGVHLCHQPHKHISLASPRDLCLAAEVCFFREKNEVTENWKDPNESLNEHSTNHPSCPENVLTVVFHTIIPSSYHTKDISHLNCGSMLLF